jgi:hypothetical protein
MSVSYSDFFPEVLPYALDVSEPQAIFAIRNACIEFCERTLIWRDDFVVDLVEGQSIYSPAVALDSRRASVVTLWVDQIKFQPTGEDYLAAKYGLDYRQYENLLGYYVEGMAGEIILAGVPQISIPGGVKGVQALAPTRDSDELGLDYVYERWAEVIAAGALSRLMSTAGQPYYNPQASMFYATKFSAGMNKAKAEVDGGNGRGRQRIQMRPFARGNYPWR